MSSNITLSAATRQNLLSLQGTADLLATTQNRLATNKKVNSALDNPTNFFTADALSSRSSSLSSLLDGISNGIQTIQAANTGLTKLQGLTDQLKSIAQQALSSSNAFSTKATNTSVALTGATAANLLSTGPTQAVSDTTVGAASATPSSATGTAAYTQNGTAATYTGGAYTTLTGNATVTINGTAINLTTGDTAAQAIAKINLQTATTGVTASGGAGGLVLTGTKAGAQITYASTGTETGIANGPTTTSNGVAATDQTLTINGTAIQIGASVSTTAQALAAINAQTSVTGVTAVDAGTDGGGAATGVIKLKGAADGSGTFTAAGSASNTLGFAAGGATVTAGVFSPLPTSLATSLGFTAGDNFTVNGQSVSIAATDTVTSLAQKVTIATNGTVSATFDATNRKFNFTAADSSTAVTLGNGSTATAKVAKLGFNANTTFAAGLGSGSASPLAGTSLTVKVGTGVSTSFTFGTAPGQISNLTQLNASLASVNAQASIDSVTGKIAITSTNDFGADNLTVTVAGGSAFTSGTSSAIVGGDGATTRNGLVSTYNNLLTQINQLASDAGFNGLNLLAGDSMKLSFNEKGSSSLNIQGTAISASNLGLSNVGNLDFQENGSIAKVMTAIGSASAQLKAQASSLGSNLAVVQNRQDFTKQIINVLDTGAANLTNADLNEEAANSQALSTRNSLGISALSLANQAQQSVLQLLR